MMNDIAAAQELATADPLRELTTKPRRGWLPRVLLWLVVVGLLATAGWFYFSRANSAPQQHSQQNPRNRDEPQPVAVATVSKQDVDVYLNGLGSVTPLNTVAIKSRVDGQLIKVTFQEGQMIKAGELLAEIDPRPFQVQLTQAQGQMAKDQALLNNAKTDLARYRTLFEQDSIARQQVDTQASLVSQYAGALKADQGLIDNAKLQLTYTRITAPISGRLGLRQIDVGNIVHAGDANGLVVITQLQPITVVFTIPEDNVPALMKKLQAGETLAVDAYDREAKNKIAAGNVTTVDNQIDATTGTIKVKAQFPNTDFTLFPNQFVNARVLLDVRRGASVIPAPAVQRGARGTFVYVTKPDNTVSVRSVKLGPAQAETVAVEEGLAVGERVVVDGTDKLREGAKILLAGDTPAPVAASPERNGKQHRGQKPLGESTGNRTARE
jgi:membrane fusion protein, multidrug efflux system